MANPNKVFCDKDEGPDDTELVDRRVFGVKVVSWVPKGTRNEFIQKERTSIAELYARQMDSDDPDNTSEEASDQDTIEEQYQKMLQ